MATEFTIINRTIQTQPEITDVIVQGDTNSKTITFNMSNRYFDGVDLSQKIIKTAYMNANGDTNYDVAILNTIDVDSFTFDWLISGGVTVAAGEVSIWVEFSELELPYVWKTKPVTFNVEQSFDVTETAVPLSYIVQESFYTSNLNDVITNIGDTNEPIYITGRRILMPTIEDLVVSGDNRSHIISFTIDRIFQNIDLSTKVISIKFINANGKGDRSSVINKVVTDTTITFGWLLDSKVTIKDGYVKFAIEFLGYDEFSKFTVWSTIPSQFEVSFGLAVDELIEEPSPTWIQSWELEKAELINLIGSSGGDGSIVYIGKSPYINNANGNWFEWDDISSVYVDTGKKAEGTDGVDGIQGLQGIKGDTGANGLQGIQGIQGIQGVKGDSFIYSDFTPEQLLLLKGEQGLQGVNGTNGLNGADGEDGYTPVNGTDYFTTAEIMSFKTDIVDDINSFITVIAISNIYAIDFVSQTSINISITTADTLAKTVTVSNVPTRTEMYLELVYTNVAAITWFSGITWLSGSAPTLTDGKTYRMCFFTSDGGTTWHGVSVGGW